MATNPKHVRILTINTDTLEVRACVGLGETSFEVSAVPFQWASKMLMKVCDLPEGVELDRGTRISVGQRAKRAIQAAGLSLPVAVLKRPHKTAEEVAVAQVAAELDAAPPVLVHGPSTYGTATTPANATEPKVVIDYDSLSMGALRVLCKNRELDIPHHPTKGQLVALLSGAPENTESSEEIVAENTDIQHAS